MTVRVAYLQDWVVPHFWSARYDLGSSGIPFDPNTFPRGFADPSLLAANAGETTERAKALVAARYGADAHDVVLAVGASGGVFLAALALADEARTGHVVVETPVYEPLFRTFEALGVGVRYVERRAEHGYLLAPEVDAARALADGATCVVITNPHNPSGRCEDLDAIGALAEAMAPAWLIIDEVYLEGVPGARSAWELGAPNVAVVSSLTKTWGLGFMRFGWVLAPAALRAKLDAAAFHTPGLYPGPIVAAAVDALGRLDTIRAEAIAHLAGRNARIASALADHPVLDWTPPDGELVISTIHLRGIADDMAFARHMLETHGLALAPGTYFRAPGTLRLGSGARPEAFDEGLEILARVAREYAGGR